MKTKRRPRRLAKPTSNGRATRLVKTMTDGEVRARKKLRKLWRRGDLFHNFWRWPRRKDVPKVDRLAGVLERGILAPASCPKGLVNSDLHILVTGAPIPYDSLVFLHHFGDNSYLYTMSEPGRMAAFVDPKISFLTPEDMGKNWCILSQDEVYVRNHIPVESLLGICVHDVDADSIVEEMLPDLERAGVPIYLYDGTPVWPTV